MTSRERAAGGKNRQLPNRTDKLRTDPNALFRQNRAAAWGALRKYFPGRARDEDLRQVAELALWQACRYYDPGRGSFTSFAYAVVRREVLEYLAGEGRQTGRLSAGEGPVRTVTVTAGWEPPGEGGIPWVDLEGFFRALPRKRHREIVRLRAAGFGNGEIAARLGVDVKTVKRDLEQIRAVFDQYI